MTKYSLKQTTPASIARFLIKHPAATRAQIAKGLHINLNQVSGGVHALKVAGLIG